MIERALTLYNRGDAFEAHEVLEEAWHGEGRTGDTAAMLKALIKVCAARIKAEQNNAVGRDSHADGAGALIDELSRRVARPELLGVSFEDVRAEIARVRRRDPPALTSTAASTSGSFRRPR